MTRMFRCPYCDIEHTAEEINEETEIELGENIAPMGVGEDDDWKDATFICPDYFCGAEVLGCQWEVIEDVNSVS